MGRTILDALAKTIAAVATVLLLATPFVGAEERFTPGESVSGQTETCGWGTWIAGEQRAFDHPVSFSIQIDSDRGYVVDCYSGTDAYFEFQAYYFGDTYVYVVWGQLGDYS